MHLLKRVVTVLALLYLLVALLFLFFPAVRSSMSVFGMQAYTLAMEVNLLLGLTWVAVIVMGLLLLVENADSGLLRRTVTQQERKINELKAQLYETTQPLASPASPGPVAPAAPYPTAYNTPPTTPPTY